MRPERHGNVAKPASQRLDRSAEASGQATEDGGKTAAEAAAGGKHGCISPDVTNLSNANRSNDGACARFSHGEACRA